MAHGTHNSRYSIGEKILENQQSIFLGILNQIRSTIARNQTPDAVGPLLRTLADDISHQLASLDAMMTLTRFPGMDEHRARHREMARHLRDFSARIEQDDDTARPELLEFTNESLSAYVQKQDTELTPWLREHGASMAVQEARRK